MGRSFEARLGTRVFATFIEENILQGIVTLKSNARVVEVDTIQFFVQKGTPLSVLRLTSQPPSGRRSLKVKIKGMLFPTPILKIKTEIL